ncbi:MAG: AAA family ATPase [Afipia sp.]|nr:AAA family ATPase [Afipia sp.]
MADDASLQERIFSDLTDPSQHPHVKRIDTHASTLLLEGDRALKIKRSVVFPFLDYSTLAKRKAACDEEIRVNREFAPQIYRRVAPIAKNSDGSFEIDGSGSPVEFAVEMLRFDENMTLDNLAKNGSFPTRVPEMVAEVIAASHAKAPEASSIQWIKSIAPIIDGNETTFRVTTMFDTGEIERLSSCSHAAFKSIYPLLERRGIHGYVRRCHGDLHLGNIVLLDGKPILFDAIEFDPSIASVDVLYDLAFPLMDLIHYGRCLEANVVLNRYLQITSPIHLDALSSLSLFISLRAAVRAKVLLAQAHTSLEIGKAALNYFSLACRSLQPPPATLVAIGGLSGTGKSRLARELAPQVLPIPGAVILRSDIIRKEIFGVGETARLPNEAYKPEVSQKVYGAMTDRAIKALRQGHSVILDGVFANTKQRNAIRGISKNLNIKFAGFFLHSDLETRIDRISHRRDDASDATPRIAEFQESYSIGPSDWESIDASGTPKQTLERCLQSSAGQLLIQNCGENV